MRRPKQGKLRWLITMLAFAMVLTGCGRGLFKLRPSPGGEDTAGQLAAALAAGSIGDLPLADRDRAILDYQQTTGALDGLLPEVEVTSVDYADSGTEATVQLSQRYVFTQGQWSFTSSAQLSYAEDHWQVDWAPSIMHPELTDTTRLYDERTTPRRGSIIGASGMAIIEAAVYKVGIDKTKAEESQFESSARALAQLMGIDADSYAQQVAASGPQAFVLAITVREGQVPAEIDTIAGAVALGATTSAGAVEHLPRGVLGAAGRGHRRGHRRWRWPDHRRRYRWPVRPAAAARHRVTRPARTRHQHHHP